MILAHLLLRNLCLFNMPWSPTARIDISSAYPKTLAFTVP